MRKGYWWIVLVALCVAIAVGVWWWVWRAPYRTLTAFVEALYNGDIKTLYSFVPEHERQIVTVDLMRTTYLRFLRSLLDRHFPKPLLVRVERFSDRPREVIFYLRFQERDKPLVIYLCYPPDRQGWKVPFSYFIWLNVKGIYGDTYANSIMKRLGYQRVATPDGGTFALRSD